MRWSRAAALLGALLFAACASSGTGEGGTSGTPGTSGDPAPSSPTLTAEERRRILELIKRYEAPNEQEWLSARDQLVAMGPEAHQALLNYLRYQLNTQHTPQSVRRSRREYAWFLQATKSHDGVVALLSDSTDKRGPDGRLVSRETFRVVAQDVLEQARNATIVIPQAGERPLNDVLLVYYTALCTDPAQFPPDRRHEVVMARINMLRLVVAGGVSEDKLALTEFYDQITALNDPELGWQWRGRIMQALAPLSGPESRALLERGTRDGDATVRQLAAESLRRRTRREKEGQARDEAVPR